MKVKKTIIMLTFLSVSLSLFSCLSPYKPKIIYEDIYKNDNFELGAGDELGDKIHKMYNKELVL